MSASAAGSRRSRTSPVIDLNIWHHAIHRVTGGMALNFNRATADDLRCWSAMLRAVADEMDAVAVTVQSRDE